MHEYQKIAYQFLFGGFLIGGIGYLFTIEFYSLSQLLLAFGGVLTFVGILIFIFSKAKSIYKWGLFFLCCVILNIMLGSNLMDHFLLQNHVNRHHTSLQKLDHLIQKHSEIDEVSLYGKLKIKSKYRSDKLLSAIQKKKLHEMMDNLKINRFRQEGIYNEEFSYSKIESSRTYYSRNLKEDSVTVSKLHALNKFLYENTKGKNCRISVNYQKVLCLECDISDYYADRILFRDELQTLMKKTKVRRITKEAKQREYYLKGFKWLYKKNEQYLELEGKRFSLGYGFETRR